MLVGVVPVRPRGLGIGNRVEHELVGADLFCRTGCDVRRAIGADGGDPAEAALGPQVVQFLIVECAHQVSPPQKRYAINYSVREVFASVTCRAWLRR
jgi:hypothetical protein